MRFTHSRQNWRLIYGMCLGSWIRMSFRRRMRRRSAVNIDRTLANQFGVDQQKTASDVLVNDQFQRPDAAEFLGRSAQRRQLSACRSDANLTLIKLGAGFMDDPGDSREKMRKASF